MVISQHPFKNQCLFRIYSYQYKVKVRQQGNWYQLAKVT